MFEFAGGESLVMVLYLGEELETNASFDSYFEDRCQKSVLKRS